MRRNCHTYMEIQLQNVIKRNNSRKSHGKHYTEPQSSKFINFYTKGYLSIMLLQELIINFILTYSINYKNSSRRRLNLTTILFCARIKMNEIR